MPDYVAVPASPLAKLLIRADESPELVIITGLSGAGKSTLCLQFAERARASDLVIGGLISLPVFSGGRKTGINLVDQLSGQSRSLASRRSPEDSGITTADWTFDAKALAWGNQQLLDLPSCDIVMLDELGPLEFTRGQGLQAGLDLIDKHNGLRIVVVIRPELLPQARARWPWAEVLAVDLAGENVDGSGCKDD